MVKVRKAVLPGISLPVWHRSMPFVLNTWNATGKPMKVRMQFIDSKGVVLKEDHLTFAETPGKWRMLSTTTGTYINAGYYKVVLSAPDMEGLALDALDVQ